MKQRKFQGIKQKIRKAKIKNRIPNRVGNDRGKRETRVRSKMENGRWSKKIQKSKTGFPIELGMTEENEKRKK